MAEFEMPEVERVEAKAIEELREKNATFLEAQYYGRVAEFRASVIQRLLGLNALHGKAGWAVYRERSHPVSNVLVDGHDKETLVAVFVPEVHGQNGSPKIGPNIRLMTNTEYRLNDEIAFFTEDVTVDTDGDAQLFVDAIFVNDSGAVMPSRDARINSWSPLFYVNGNGNLEIKNFQHFTPRYGVDFMVSNGSECRQVTVEPFGDYTNYEDRIAALVWAYDIFKATEQAELVAHYVSPQE